jgi:hypothetical protein
MSVSDGSRGATGISVSGLNLGFSLLVITVIGAIVRLLPLFGSPYPLNDGGLFVRMSQDLVANGFSIPATSTYNGEAIPFAYPPLGFFLTGALVRLTGASAVDLLHFVPALIATACIPAFYTMAAELLRSRWRGAIAAATFALLPRSYLWLIVGGGITRSLGLLFALMAIAAGVRMMRSHRMLDVVMTAVLSGLTLLAHPQAAVFLGLSLLTLFGFHVFRGDARRALTNLVAAGFGAAVIASPWILSVVMRHGWAPLLSAGQSGLDLTAGGSALLALAFTDAPVFDLLTALGVLGIFLRIARRQWMIPLWLVLAVVVDPRAGTTFATVPLSLSVVPVVGEILQRMVPGPRDAPATLETEPIPRLIFRHRAQAVLLALVLFAGLRTTARTAVDPESPLFGLSQDQTTAMSWVQKNLDPGENVAVVTGKTWEVDYLSEWFPIISGHRSIATVQGSEWTGRDHFVARLAAYRQLQQCATLTDSCVIEWARSWHLSAPYIFIPKGHLAGPLSVIDCCASLRQTLVKSPQFLVVYDGLGATILAPVR